MHLNIGYHNIVEDKSTEVLKLCWTVQLIYLRHIIILTVSQDNKIDFFIA